VDTTSGIRLDPDAPSGAVSARTLDRLSAHARTVEGVWARSIQPGDWVVVRTKNSVYSLAAAGDGSYQVAGGWFRQHGAERTPVRVAGCTWGGRALHTGLVAAPGMCLEFANGVRTTRIREVRLIRGAAAGAH
jgi:hypothetical protein